MELVIDVRERGLIQLLSGRNILFTSEALDIGDILFRNENKDTVLLIERKTLADLKASVYDGRAREQKARMMNCGLDNIRLLYLIEGVISMNESRENSLIMGSIINTQFRDDIKVYKTVSLEETAHFVTETFERLKKDDGKFFAKSKVITECEYATTLKTRKKCNFTPKIWFIKQLSMIPQISDTISTCIVEKYVTVSDLLKEYEKLEDVKQRELLLSNLTYPIKNDKRIRIGDKRSKSIYSMFYDK